MEPEMFEPKDHTFVICAYKENPFLDETILSLKQQTVLGTIILSTSTPSKYLRDICREHDIEYVVNPVQHSAGFDWNYGYDYASTPLVTIAHQDDYYEPDYLLKMLKAINRYDEGEVSLLFSDYYEIRDGNNVSNNSLLRIKRVMNSFFRFRLFNKRIFVKRRVLSFGCSICCPSVLLVKTVTGKSVFDTSFKNSCDYKTWVDLASKKGRFLYIPQKLLGHRIYEESATSRNLENSIRQYDDQEILKLLWPESIARMIYSIYAKGEESNKLG